MPSAANSVHENPPVFGPVFGGLPPFVSSVHAHTIEAERQAARVMELAVGVALGPADEVGGHRSIVEAGGKIPPWWKIRSFLALHAGMNEALGDAMSRQVVKKSPARGGALGLPWRLGFSHRESGQQGHDVNVADRARGAVRPSGV